MSRRDEELTEAVVALREWQRVHGALPEFAMLNEAIEVNLEAIERVLYTPRAQNFNPDERCSSCLKHAGELDSRRECRWCAQERADEQRGDRV